MYIFFPLIVIASMFFFITFMFGFCVCVPILFLSFFESISFYIEKKHQDSMKLGKK